jgi:hypothetical protein
VVDVLTNVIGTVIGIVLGLVFEQTALSIEARLLSFHPPDRSALMIVFFWFAWLVFPFFPITGLYVPRLKISLFMSTSPAVLPFLSAAVAWFASGRMLAAAGFRSPKIWLALSILLIPAQFFLVDRQPVPSEFLGALAGLLMFALRERTGRTTRAEAWVFLAILVLRGLTPFHLSPHSIAFGWIPFKGFLAAEWLHSIFLLIEKIYYYGAAIWLFRAAGTRLLNATIIAAATLGAIEAIQMYIPGHTPEITDPLLAILLACGLGILSRQRAPATLSPERETLSQSAE